MALFWSSPLFFNVKVVGWIFNMTFNPLRAQEHHGPDAKKKKVYIGSGPRIASRTITPHGPKQVRLNPRNIGLNRVPSRTSWTQSGLCRSSRVSTVVVGSHQSKPVLCRSNQTQPDSEHAEPPRSILHLVMLSCYYH